MWYNVCLSLSNKLRGCQSSSLTVSDSVFSFRYFFLSVAPKTRFRTFCAGFTATSRITWCCWKVDEWKEQLSVLPTHWDQLQSCHGLRDCEYIYIFSLLPSVFSMSVPLPFSLRSYFSVCLLYFLSLSSLWLTVLTCCYFFPCTGICLVL